MFWISIIAFVVGTGISTPLFYYKKFRKTNRQVATRVDMLGLEERVLTMSQLENDDSYMARRQREDTMSALKFVNESLIKISVSVSLIVVCAIAFVMGAGATTVSAVADQSLLDMLKKAEEAEIEAAEPTFTLKYKLENEEKSTKSSTGSAERDAFAAALDNLLDNGGGRIDGPVEQTVKGGNDGEAVQAVAADGYIFVGWSDGYEEDYRIDTNVSEDITVYAIFIRADFGDEDLRQDGDKSNNNNNNKDSHPDDSQPPESTPDPNQSGDDSDGGGEKGNASAPTNQVVDGSTFYGNEMNGATSDAQNAMNNMGGGEDSGMITDYFQGITQ